VCVCVGGGGGGYTKNKPSIRIKNALLAPGSASNFMMGGKG
jgi:hypothetical protein